MRFRAVPAVAAVLFTAACASTSAPGPTVSHPVTPATSPTGASVSTAPSPTATTAAGPQLRVVVQAAKLPYPAAQGAPALGDVSVLTSAADPCGIPADDSGNEGQLINAEMVGPVVVVTFEVTNPCKSTLAYAFTVTQAIGSATGPSGGPAADTVTPPIQPGRSITFKVNMDPKPSLTAAQLQQLWVGITHISKQPGY